jgi:8-oxo-dGTP pyrophosphatase MutT (NUDIX family)
MKMELWDLYDKNRRPLNKTHIRGDMIAQDVYHIIVEIWTVNSKGEILLTLRHPDKEFYPNIWEITCGSAIAGESSLEGAVRELNEETGIAASKEELVLLGTKREGNAFVDTYLVHKDIPIKSLVMQEGETVAARWVTLQKLDEMIEEGLVALPVVKDLKPLREEFKKHIL